jgi:cysteine-rich repeat protein
VPGKHCTPACGDKVLAGTETCDDGNTASGDGCSSTCQVEPGAECFVPGQPCVKSICGNGKVEKGELCDCGTDMKNLPVGCKGINGLFYGNGKGCSKTCTKEPNCRDSVGHNQACDATCGDGNLDPGEECDDGNLAIGDGCSNTCSKEPGFTCESRILQDSSTCQSGSGTCLALPIIYRDFLPQNVAGGHPDFLWLGTQSGGQVVDWCVPNSGGPSKGNDSMARCWDLIAPDLLNGKPQYNSGRANNLCDCRNTDWNVSNSSRIKGGYSETESPLWDPSTADYRTGVTFTTTADIPTWSGQVPAITSADTFNQWFNDDSSVNQTFVSVIELPSVGTSLYQFASKSHLMEGGFFPLDSLNASQKTLCNMWPYWHQWTSCSGDQYLMPPRVTKSDCPSGTVLSDGCWVTGLNGQTHDNYFTEEARYYFVYDANTGITLQFYGDDDLFIFINGKLVLDLGGVHQQLPGKVTVSGNPGDAAVIEGGCLDSAGNITGVTSGSTVCSATNASPTPPSAKSPDDFRNRTVSLGLVNGKTYEIAIFGADRHPPESNFQLTLNGYTTKRSICTPRCGDGLVSASEECDNGSQNDDTAYGGCTQSCKLGPFCGDGNKNGPEACDLGKQNGDTSLGKDGCTVGCTKPHYCGDGIVDASLDEECDLGQSNGQPDATCSSVCKVVPS